MSFQIGTESVLVCATVDTIKGNNSNSRFCRIIREILQPTIFDPSAFLVWSEEAFSLWTSMWLNLYEFGSTSYELIEEIRDTYFLVAIIDNDYIAANNGTALWKTILNAYPEAR